MPKALLNLTGKWEFKEYPLAARRMRDLDDGNWSPAIVPSSIFNSLIESGQIDKTDIETNHENYGWVSKKPWIYRKTFDVSADMLECDRVDLVFEGLDTVASVWLNEKLVAKTNNMFIPFRFDVTSFLKPKNNSLLVKFEPAAQHAKKLMERYTLFDEAVFANPYRAYIRKAQYQFGWDWCPSLPGCGIWRPVYIEGIKNARLTDLHVRTINHNHQYADVRIAVQLDTVTKHKYTCKLVLSHRQQQFEQDMVFCAGESSHSTVIRINNPSLWWPAGYGPQNLYQLEIKLLSDNEIIDHAQSDIGIRTIRLDRSADQHGQKFQFEVNGQPVYARGANWIPASVFAGSVTGDDYDKLLHAAADANINMLRVWGGGYYETEQFYQLCDKLGIMVWQDFMFACAYYPDRHWFLQDVRIEAAAIIKHLRNFSCIALWCGNNEIDWMHSCGVFRKGKKFFGREIYHKILPRLLSELDPDRDYVPTTPFSITKNQNDPGSGTVHQWGVWSGHQPVSNLRCEPEDIPRFVTEFGMQSLPDIETIKKFCPATQLRVGSETIEKHNYQLDGNGRLYRYVGDLFGQAKHLEQFIYLSQVTHARGVKEYVEHLRAHNFRNKGVLFWQFNDSSPAISWSAMDYLKKPKALYYYAKHFFSNRLIVVVPRLDTSKTYTQFQAISAVAINDSSRPLSAKLNCRLIDFWGNVLDQVSLPVAIAPFGISVPLKFPKAIMSPDEPDKSCLHLEVETHGDKIAENLFLYLPDKYIDWPQACINREFQQLTDTTWKLKLNSNILAKDVQIYGSQVAHLSDNFIDLMPNRDYEVDIRLNRPSLKIENATYIKSINSIF
jgi:beta-mannosidase